MDRGLKGLLLLIFLPLLSFSQELTACYKAYFTFLPVAQTCITYTYNNSTASAKSWVKTINVGKIVKRVYNHGVSHMVVDNSEIKPKLFQYHQEEGTFKRYQEYRFENGKIHTKEIHYVELSDTIERQENNVFEYKNSPDPYIAALVLYKESAFKNSGSISMFYDGKYYAIPYRVIGDEKVNTKAGEFEAQVLEVQPKVHTKGLLRPKGAWLLWIDKHTRLPIRMQLSFVIGSVRADLEKVEGDRETLKRMFVKKIASE